MGCSPYGINASGSYNLLAVTKSDRPTSIRSSDRIPGQLKLMKLVNDLGRIVSVEQNHARPEHELAGLDCDCGASCRSNLCNAGAMLRTGIAVGQRER